MTQIMERDDEPGVTGFLYIMRDQVSEALRGQDDQKDGFSTGENLVIYAYDEYGEEHGRRTFQFALDAPGAVDLTKVTNMEGVTNGQGESTYSQAHEGFVAGKWYTNIRGKLANVGEMRGKTRIEFQTIALEQLSYELIMKSAEWFDTLPSYGGSIAQTAMLAFEFKALASLTPRPLRTSFLSFFLQHSNPIEILDLGHYFLTCIFRVPSMAAQQHHAHTHALLT
jgi:hypothetical protein